ncbi:MAG: 2-hydroxyacid dehydrogenase [Burkholderiaceae bacterium]
MAKPHLLITRRVYPEAIEALSPYFQITDNQAKDTPTTKEGLVAAMAQADYLFCTVADKIDADVIAAAPRLKMIATGAVGYNNIDIQACKARGIALSNTPDVLTETTADFGWALLMATARRISESERYVRDGQWKGWAFDQFTGVDLHSTTLGILGMGRIGGAIARRASGFNMKVIYHNRSKAQQEYGAQYVDKAQLLSQSDHLMIVVPYSPATHHLVTAADLVQMKPTATLINIARGGVVNDADLLLALQQKQIRAAGLDVFENEPALNPGFLKLDNVVLTPHIASSSRATRGRMVMLAAENLLAHVRASL